LSGSAALKFLTAVQGGSILTLTARPDSPLVSLEGLTEALVAMDRAQGRANNQSALIHGGRAAPASAIPAAPALPLVRAAPAHGTLPNASTITGQVRRARASDLRRHECDLARRDDQVERLNALEVIVVLSCNSGAYQGYALAFRAPIANPLAARIIRLPMPKFLGDAADGDAAAEYGAGHYDPETATFSQTSLGRGIGDCGMGAEWVFDGRAFRLASLSYQDRCGGQPGDWMPLYRTRILELD